jgi:hypothetical protein
MTLWGSGNGPNALKESGSGGASSARLGVQFEILLTQAAGHRCMPRARCGLYVTLLKSDASKGGGGGDGSPAVGLSPAGKEGSW